MKDSPFREDQDVYITSMINQVTHECLGIEIVYADETYYKAVFEDMDSGDLSMNNINLKQIPRPHEVVSCRQFGIQRKSAERYEEIIHKLQTRSLWKRIFNTDKGFIESCTIAQSTRKLKK